MEKKENKVEKCVLCGLCKAVCPSFEIVKGEKHSPRGRAFIIKEDEKPDSTFYDCTLCGACSQRCPAGVKIPLQQQRVKLVNAAISSEANRKMVDNIRKYGNPFGKLKKGEVPKELYCC